MDIPQRQPEVWDADIHQALSSPVRTRIMALLGANDDLYDVPALADELGLHANTVRSHLTILERAGLVASRTVPRHGPGRPRHAYGATARANQVADARAYRMLARMLAGQVAGTQPDPEAAGVATGRAWGRSLVAESPLDTTGQPRAALRQVVELLDDFGFAPELVDAESPRPQLHLHRCPFLDVSREHQDVVCSIHLGLMRGTLEELGADIVVDDLLPFVEPSLCISNLHVTI